MKICLIDTVADNFRVEFTSRELYTIKQCLSTGILPDDFGLDLFNIRENLIERVGALLE